MEKGTQEMTFRDETIADAVSRLNEINAQLRKLTDERCEIYDVLNALQYKPGPAKITVVDGVKFTTRKKPVIPKPRKQNGDVETINTVISGRRHWLRKPIVATLLKLQTFRLAKVVAQVRKYHKTSSRGSAARIARYYIQYMLDNKLIVKGAKLRYTVAQGNNSLTRLTEGV